jgi:3-phenylpropionate/trans-cinnamate dioxygenase ferredoxin component
VSERINWIDAGAAADIAEDTSISIVAGDRIIAVARSGGELFAIEDVCTHDGEALTGGGIEAGQIVCPRHGARFCLRTGAALTPPAYEPVRVFPLKLEDGHVWVREG